MDRCGKLARLQEAAAWDQKSLAEAMAMASFPPATRAVLCGAQAVDLDVVALATDISLLFK